MKSINVIKWFGASILCYPVDALFTCGRDEFSKTIIQVAHLVTQILLLVSPCIIALAQAPISPYVGANPPLSERIEIGLFYLGTTLPYVIIRASSIMFRDDIMKLYADLETFPTGAGTNWKRRKVFLGILTLSFLWFWVKVSASIYFLSKPRSQGCSILSVPCDDTTIMVVLLFSDLSVVVTVFYAWSFVNLCGVSLMNCLNRLTASCESSFNGDVALRRKMNGISNAAIGNIITKIVDEFRSIKVNFDRYSKVGGAYSLALLIHFALTAIGILSYLFAGIPASSRAKFPLRHATVLCFPSLFAVVYFGDYVTQAVHHHLSRLYDLQAQNVTNQNDQVGRLLIWLRKWQWKFSAQGLFDIDCGLVTGVVATIITYFIFLFQLKASEKEMVP